jgi:DNA-binding protein YbaB
MEQRERDAIRSANNELRSSLETIQEQFEAEMSQAGDVYRKLAAIKVRATSPNELAKVTVNSAGMVLDIQIADDAYHRSTPKLLADDLNAAIRGAVDAANQARAKVVEPMQAIVDGMADLSDIVPGAPSLRQLRDQLSQPSMPPENPGKQRDSRRP